ncbi:MAG: molybdopterin cofactor-binding domain-containing protein, partial [Eubacteriales bacterium]
MVEYKYIGKPIKSPDMDDKVTGTLKFAGDLNFVNQLYGAVLRSPHPHANILSIDTSAAKSFPGVKVVITGEEEHTGVGHYCYEMPTLAYKRVLYEGDPVVAVAAETLEIAYEALKLVRVDYELLKPILSVEESMAEGAEIINDWSTMPCHKEMHYIQDSNVCHLTSIKNGDVEEDFKNCDYIVESYYETSGIQHVCMEGHVTIAQWDSQGLTIWGPMQSPNFMRGQLSKAFSLPFNKIRCIITPIGGGFGNKWELRSEPIAAALAKYTKGRPVKLVFNRKDEFYGAYVRGGQKLWHKTGVMKDGTLVARKIKILGDVGA